MLLVGVSGPSSSGKSTVVSSINSLLPRCTVVHLDDFYYPDEQIPIDKTHNVQNWDCAEAIDWRKFKDYLIQVKESCGTILPIDTLEADLELALSEGEHREMADLVRKLVGLKDEHVVLVDGFMLYHDREIADLLDVKLLFRAPYEVLKSRREARAGYNTIEGFWSDPPNYFDNIVWPGYIASHKHLFEAEDVSAGLSSEGKDLGIEDITRGISLALATMVRDTLISIGKHVGNDAK